MSSSFVWEYRQADIAYSIPGTDLWLGDQVKTAKSTKKGNCIFQAGKRTILNVEKMIEILSNKLILTCIGKDVNNEIDVVWMFYGESAINELKKFSPTQRFQPYLHLKNKSYNNFTISYNVKRFRYDVGDNSREITRLFKKRYDIVKKYAEYTLEHFNTHVNHLSHKWMRQELESIQLIMDVCKTHGSDFRRDHQDAHSSIDFRIDNVKIQDKTGKSIKIREKCGYPYNPNDFDVLQITNIEEKIVYVLPMRIENDGKITSFFTERALMQSNFSLTEKWKKNHEQFRFDLQEAKEQQKYLDAIH